MHVIYKYPFRTTSPMEIPVGPDDEVIHVGLDPSGDPNLPCIWMLHRNADVPSRERRTFAFAGTGQPLDGDPSFFGSVVTADGFVWHVYAEEP